MTPAWDPEVARRLIVQLRLPSPLARASMDVIAEQLEAALSLAAALREACDLASPATADRMRDLVTEGYEVADRPMFTRIGDVVVVERLVELRALAGEP